MIGQRHGSCELGGDCSRRVTCGSRRPPLRASSGALWWQPHVLHAPREAGCRSV